MVTDPFATDAGKVTVTPSAEPFAGAPFSLVSALFLGDLDCKVVAPTLSLSTEPFAGAFSWLVSAHFLGDLDGNVVAPTLSPSTEPFAAGSTVTNAAGSAAGEATAIGLSSAGGATSFCCVGNSFLAAAFCLSSAANLTRKASRPRKAPGPAETRAGGGGASCSAKRRCPAKNSEELPKRLPCSVSPSAFTTAARSCATACCSERRAS